MKKIIYTISILFCLAIFSSCSKCMDCSCTQLVSQTGTPDINQTVEFNDVCDEELDELEGNTTITQNVGGITQTIEQSCDCN